MTLLLPAFTVRIFHPRAAASRARALAEMVGKFQFGSGVVVVVTGVCLLLAQEWLWWVRSGLRRGQCPKEGRGQDRVRARRERALRACSFAGVWECVLVLCVCARTRAGLLSLVVSGWSGRVAIETKLTKAALWWSSTDYGPRRIRHSRVCTVPLSEANQAPPALALNPHASQYPVASRSHVPSFNTSGRG